jgi:hypothetical protein
LGFFRGDENVLKLDVVMAAQFSEYIKSTNFIFKRLFLMN